MACFLVPAAEAVITTIAAKAIKSKEKKSETAQVNFDGTEYVLAEKIPFSRKIKWLNNLLWGGSALLAFEHVWHGEIIPQFPFLTAAADPAAAAEMMHEMSTVGVTMSVIVTTFWMGMVIVTAVMEKKTIRTLAVKN